MDREIHTIKTIVKHSDNIVTPDIPFDVSNTKESDTKNSFFDYLKDGNHRLHKIINVDKYAIGSDITMFALVSMVAASCTDKLPLAVISAIIAMAGGVIMITNRDDTKKNGQGRS